MEGSPVVIVTVLPLRALCKYPGYHYLLQDKLLVDNDYCSGPKDQHDFV
jgi:hypothetical protein